jgi:hypothetical protein
MTTNRHGLRQPSSNTIYQKRYSGLACLVGGKRRPSTGDSTVKAWPRGVDAYSTPQTEALPGEEGEEGHHKFKLDDTRAVTVEKKENSENTSARTRQAIM